MRLGLPLSFPKGTHPGNRCRAAQKAQIDTGNELDGDWEHGSNGNGIANAGAIQDFCVTVQHVCLAGFPEHMLSSTAAFQIVSPSGREPA